MLVYYFVPFIVSNRYLLFWVSSGHNSVTVQNRTHVYMNFFHHKDLGNHHLQLCLKVVKHPVYPCNSKIRAQDKQRLLSCSCIASERVRHRRDAACVRVAVGAVAFVVKVAALVGWCLVFDSLLVLGAYFLCRVLYFFIICWSVRFIVTWQTETRPDTSTGR